MSPIHEIDMTILMAPKSVQHGARAHVVGKKSGFPHLRFYTDSNKNAYLQRISEEVKHLVPKQPLLGPLEIQFEFYLPRPDIETKAGLKSFKMLPVEIRKLIEDKFAGRIPLWEHGNNLGDWDNFCKGTQDALGKAGFFKNDGQIVRGGGVKFLTELAIPSRIQAKIIQYSFT
jgi:Holliday junction resolvase RusA-like endonuclease